MIKKLQLIIGGILAVLFVSVTPVYAVQNGQSSGAECGGTKTQLIACDSEAGVETIGNLIKVAISVMTVLIGVVATGGIAYAAVLYASARDDQEKVRSALGIIRNIVIGLVLYGFTIAIINWLIPGGVIG